MVHLEKFFDSMEVLRNVLGNRDALEMLNQLKLGI